MPRRPYQLALSLPRQRQLVIQLVGLRVLGLPKPGSTPCPINDCTRLAATLHELEYPAYGPPLGNKRTIKRFDRILDDGDELPGDWVWHDDLQAYVEYRGHTSFEWRCAEHSAGMFDRPAYDPERTPWE